MIYTMTISPAIDYVVHLEELAIGMTNRSSEEEYYFGGKGINVSVVLANLGIPTIAMGFVAGFTGKALEEGLKSQGTTTDFVHVKNGITRINVKIKGHKETEINGQGAIPTKEEFSELLNKLDTLTAEDTLILSGAIPKGLPEDTYERILNAAKKKKSRCVVDTSGKLLLSTLKFNPYLIKPNYDELKELFGNQITPESGAEKLKSLGARNVIVSLGAGGSMLLAETNQFYYCKAASGRVLNTVGSGDSMVAGFLAGMSDSIGYQRALNLSSAAGSATAFTPGLATKEKIASCLVEIEKL